jgi:hypothetical protein
MPRQCVVCVHPKRDEINRKLLEVGASPSKVAAAYGLAHSSVDRHKRNHLKVSSVAVSEAANARVVIGYAHKLYERSVAVLDRAEAILASPKAGPGSVQAAASSVREVRGSIELLAKLVVTDEPTREDTQNAWLDAQLTEAVQRMTMPELPPGEALTSGVDDAVIVQEPD